MKNVYVGGKPFLPLGKMPGLYAVGWHSEPYDVRHIVDIMKLATNADGRQRVFSYCDDLDGADYLKVLFLQEPVPACYFYPGASWVGVYKDENGELVGWRMTFKRLWWRSLLKKIWRRQACKV